MTELDMEYTISERVISDTPILPPISQPPVKDPRLVAAGKAGMLARWGVPRRVRLDNLTDAQRRAVLTLVAAFEAENGGLLP